MIKMSLKRSKKLFTDCAFNIHPNYKIWSEYETVFNVLHSYQD